MGTRFLRSIGLFAELPEKWLDLAEGLLEGESFSEDEIVFRAGDASDGLYIVEEGEITLFTDTVGEPVTLMARIPRGGLFGEVGVLEDSQRSASARASVPSRTLKLVRPDLIRLVRAHPTFGRKLSELAVRRVFSDSTALELGKRREPRVRLGSPVRVRIDDRAPISLLLENLSVGGLSLRGVPEDFYLPAEVDLGIADPDGEELLATRARIAWRRKSAVGVAFVGQGEGQTERVREVLDTLLAAAASSPAEEPAEEDLIQIKERLLFE